MIEKRARSRINASAKCKLIIFLNGLVYLLQFVESQDSSSVNDCGGEFSGYRYVISSPNYPAPYPRKQNCIFTLRGSPLATCDQTFNLQFLDFSLSPSENCTEDYVEIGDRSLFCGKVVGIRKYASKDNTLVVRFRSGAGLGNKGFRILVTTLPCSPEQQTNQKSREEKLEQSGTTLGNAAVTGSAASHKDATTYFSSYQEFVRGQVPSPPKVDSLAESEDNRSLLREHEQQRPNNLDSRVPVGHLEVPVNGPKLFRASTTTSLGTGSSVTPSSSSTLQSIEDKRSRMLSSYLLVPGNRWNDAEFQDQQKSNSTGNKVLDNPGGWIDCQGKSSNLQPDLEVATTLRAGNINNRVFGAAPLYPSGWSLPDPRVPCYSYVSNENSASNPSPGQYGGPPPNIFNGYQSLIPSSGGGSAADDGQLALCCNVFYSGQKFLLSSPGFPSASYSPNPFECGYSIIPYSTDTCSMRFNFKFFNHGTEDPFCSNGYIEIDGRLFCGCKTGLAVASVVTSALPKILRFRYTGYPRTKFHGFLIQVIQEPCPNDSGYLSRSKKEIGNSSGVSSGRSRRDSGYDYPKPPPIFGLVEEPGGSGQSCKSGYAPRGQSWYREGTTSGNLFSSCEAFSFLDWIHAAKEAYLRNGRCIGTNSSPGNILPDTIVSANPGSGGSGGSGGWNHPCANCQDINVVEGIISSPRYPTNYPNNVRKCFRFYRAPESCYLELVIFDFDLEHSNGCTKDYVTFSGSSDRYCGSWLAGKTTSFDISRGQTLVMCFVTDGYGSGRGFGAGFSQIPCQRLVNR